MTCGNAAAAAAAAIATTRNMTTPWFVLTTLLRVRVPAPSGLCPDALARLERALHVAVGFAFGDVSPLVADFLPARERELDLRATVLEVELRRDERQAALRHLAGERRKLLLVYQELAVAVGIVVR